MYSFEMIFQTIFFSHTNKLLASVYQAHTVGSFPCKTMNEDQLDPGKAILLLHGCMTRRMEAYFYRESSRFEINIP